MYCRLVPRPVKCVKCPEGGVLGRAVWCDHHGRKHSLCHPASAGQRETSGQASSSPIIPYFLFVSWWFLAVLYITVTILYVCISNTVSYRRGFTVTADLARGLKGAIPTSFITVGWKATQGATVRAALKRPKLMANWTWLAQRVCPRFNHVGRAEGRIRHRTDRKSTVPVVISTFAKTPLRMLGACLQILQALLFDIAVLKYTRQNIIEEGMGKEILAT